MSRADRVAGRLEDVDALLVTEPANLRYVTGFTGSNGFAVVGPQIRRFVTDFRYVEQAKVEVPDFDRERGPQELLAAVGHGLDGVKRLGFDEAHLSVRAHKRLGELLPPHVELVPAAGVVEEVRAVKEPGEILRIGAAAALVDEIYAWLLEFGLVGRTERDVAVALEHEMRLRGASGPSFDSIVASAEHGALPHATPRDVAIAPDTLVTLDIGAVLDGYCSDCTRTWATGASVPDELVEIYALTLRAQVTSLDAVRPGPLGREIDAIARDIIDAAGHAEHFGHGLGHGVGLVTHEAPRLARSRHGAARRRQRRDRRAGRLSARRGRRPDRGSGGRHRDRPRRPLEDDERAPGRRIGSSPRRQAQGGRGAADIRGRWYFDLAPAPCCVAPSPRPHSARSSCPPWRTRRPRAPVITKVTPKTAAVGTKLTITGQELQARQGQEQRAVPARQGQGPVREGRRERPPSS